MGIVIDPIYHLSRPRLTFEEVPTGRGGYTAGPHYFTPLTYSLDRARHNIHGPKLAQQREGFDIWLDGYNGKTKEVTREFLLEGCYIKEIKYTQVFEREYADVRIDVSTLTDCTSNNKVIQLKQSLAYNSAMEILEGFKK